MSNIYIFDKETMQVNTGIDFFLDKKEDMKERFNIANVFATRIKEFGYNNQFKLIEAFKEFGYDSNMDRKQIDEAIEVTRIGVKALKKLSGGDLMSIRNI